MRETATAEKQSEDKGSQKLKEPRGCVTSVNNSDKRQNNLSEDFPFYCFWKFIMKLAQHIKIDLWWMIHITIIAQSFCAHPHFLKSEGND